MSASSSHPTLDKTPNGIDIIQIAKPNDAGISNNFYIDFNISQDGLILNNIAKDDKLAQSILAGYISANENLTSSAKLILNQVTGNDISKLLGYLEVAGKSADVIIANPNGITCQGCGFLNVENLTLATGRFSEAELERLSLLKNYEELKTLSLDITQGKIITQALDARNTKSLTFLAKSMEVDGMISGGDKIRMLLGANHVEFSPSVLLYEPIKLAKSDEPALALDVAYLGGAVAKSIYIVATQEGIGVRNSGLMASTASVSDGDGGFSIDVNGKLEISAPKRALALDLHKEAIDLTETSTEAKEEGFAPALFSGSSLTIKAKDFANHSILYAAGDLSIEAHTVLNQGSLEFEDRVVGTSHFYSRDPNINGFFGGSNTYYTLYDYTITTKEHATKKETYSPALILGGNITIKSDTTTNDTAIIKATNKFDNQSKEFKNIDPQAKKTAEYNGTMKVYDRYGDCSLHWLFGSQNWNCASISKYYAYNRADDIEYIDNNLPEITAQDMTGYLSEAISTARASASMPIAYMQDSTTLNSLLAGSVDTATLIDPSILDIFARGSLSLGISASSMHITSDDFYNSGSMSADSIYVASSVFINENGEILSGKSLALSGGSVANKGGKLSGDSIDIKADGFLNTSSVIGNAWGEKANQNSEVSQDTLDSKYSNMFLASKGVISGGDIYINSGVMQISGADIKAKNLNIDTNNLISSSVELKNESHTQGFMGDIDILQTNQVASNIKAGKININASNQSYMATKIEGKDIELNGDNIEFSSAKNIDQKNISYTEEKNGALSYSKKALNIKEIHEHSVNSELIGNVTINTKENFKAYNLNANTQNLFIDSGKSIVIEAEAQVENPENITSYIASKLDLSLKSLENLVNIKIPDTQPIIGGAIYSAGNIDLKANDISLVGADMNANGDITMVSQTLNIDASGVDKSLLGKGEAKYIASNIDGKNVSIDSNNINIISSNIKADGVIGINGEDILFDTRLGKTSYLESNKTNQIGFLKSTSTKETIRRTYNTNIASSLEGKKVDINLKSNLSANNINVKADEFKVVSGGKITLSNKADLEQTITDRHTTESGFKGKATKKSISISVGKDTTDEHQEIYKLTHNSTNINANKITLNAADVINIESTNLNGDNVALNGAGVNIIALENQENSFSTKHTTSNRIGFSVDTDTIKYGLQKLGNKVFGDIIKVGQKPKNTQIETSFTNKNDTEQHNRIKTSAASADINAGMMDIHSDSNTNIIGSNINATELNINTDQINIAAIETKEISSDTTKSRTIEFGVGANIGEDAEVKIRGSYSNSNKHVNTNKTTHVGSKLDVVNLNLNAKSDVKVEGSDINTSGVANIQADSFTMTAITNTTIEDTTQDSLDISGSTTIGSHSFAMESSGGSLKKQTHDTSTTHVISSLKAGTLNLNTSKDTNIIGSKLKVDGEANLISKNLNITDYQSENTNKENEIKNNGGGSFNVGNGFNMAGNGSHSNKHTSKTDTTFSGSNVDVGKLNIQTSQTTRIKGSELHATQTQIKTNDLDIVSSAKHSSEHNDSFSISGDFAFGNSKNAVNSNTTYENHNKKVTQQVESKVTLGDFDIQSSGDTNIRGSKLVGNSGKIQTQNLNLISTQDTTLADGISADLKTHNFSMKADGKLDGSLDIKQHNSSLETDSLQINTDKDLTIKGGNIQSGLLGASVDGDLFVASTPDISVSGSVSASMGTSLKDFSFDPDMRGIVDVKKRSGIDTSIADIKVGGSTTLIGGRIEAFHGNMQTGSLLLAPTVNADIHISKESIKNGNSPKIQAVDSTISGLRIK